MLSAVNCDDEQNFTDLYYKEIEIEKPSFDYDDKDNSRGALKMIKKIDNGLEFLQTLSEVSNEKDESETPSQYRGQLAH